MNKLKTILGLVILLINTIGTAQNKGKIAPEDYNQWVQLQEEQMTQDGKWIAFHTRHQLGKDTLFLQNTKTRNLQKFANGEEATFSPDANWFTYKSNDSLVLINLRTNNVKKETEVSKIGYDKVSGSIALLTKDKKLHVQAPNDTTTRVFEKTDDFEYNENGDLALITDKGIEIHKAGRTKSTVAIKANKATKLKWDNTGQTVYYFDQSKEGITSVVAFDQKRNRVYKMNITDLTNLDIEISTESKVVPAPEANRCFFYAKSKKKGTPTDDSLVEIWEAASPLQYPAQKNLERIPYIPKIYSWEMKSGKIEKLVSDSLFTIKILPGKQKTIAYCPIKAGQLQLDSPVVNHYLSTIGKEENKLFLKDQSTAVGRLMPAPDGRHLGYVNESGWNHYDDKTKTHTLVLERKDFKKYTGAENEECTSIGWTSDSRYCVVYVGEKLILISEDGKEKSAITNTIAPEMTFKIIKQMHKRKNTPINEEINYSQLDYNKGIFLQAYNPDKSMALYKWTKQKGLERVYKSAGKIAVTATNEANTILTIREESDIKPPSIKMLYLNTKKSKEMYQSNQQYQKYATPRVELLSYVNTKGDSLNALLHYPIGYTKNKQYPMIVYLYETLSQNRYQYNNPSYYSPTGFALANYTNNDYFVLQPDIKYTRGDPGTSIVDAVEKAVEKAVSTANINSKKMGLIGHSYGGHEVALTICKTHLFAAAVAGAASTNMISDYLNLNEQTNRIKFSHFEVQQYRMGTPPFYNWEAYAKNSPVMNAEKCTTPVLSWTGKADGTVNWRQSVEFHLALKRLNKKNTLLVYPNEGHILSNPEAQIDLNNRIKEWFEQWLK